MESPSDKKKKNFIGSWLDRLLYPRSLYEFETPLTPYQCYERLQKLPGKTDYLKAKSKVELANAGARLAFELQWKPQENVCEFVLASQTRNNDAGLRGKVFFSEIYEKTQVSIRAGNPSNRELGCRRLLIIACIFGVIAISQTFDSFLRMIVSIGLCCSPFVVFLVIVIVLVMLGGRDNLKLLRIVLTEPDESQL
ncbi:MAG: hypothetical protein ABI690_12340 [Chloroflexota bacterium]